MKVLIVSSYQISCGIASYTAVLKSLLENDFEVSVAPLDQSVLRRLEQQAVQAGDRQIRAICESFKDYDVVNLQWEPGLLGATAPHMMRRFRWLIDAAPNLIVTVHTALPYPQKKSLTGALGHMRRHGLRSLPRYLVEGRFERAAFAALSNRAKAGGNFAIAVHNERERNFYRNVVGIESVHAHPLSNIRAGWRTLLDKDTPVARQRLEALYPDRRTFIGVFGFLSEYKGIQTAIKAMNDLDDGHQLLIYGSVHPEAIRHGQTINPYVKELIDGLEKAEFRDRVAFIGSPDDYEFALAINTVDICVFPYVDVASHSGSGPLAHAIELGKPTVATRTRSFLEMQRYFPKAFEMFDVGNHLQLAQAIERIGKVDTPRPAIRYDNETLAAFYADLIRNTASKPAVRPGAQANDAGPGAGTLKAAE
ncbi:MAG: glycosyltransferase [Bauldia sp.]|nr:glycosyltransferase [Bauldia sp.]